ncbi:hypothetical protein [Tumebacillus flagellatus]|uniref:Uncharacterized protein n=1 Tax=Tumebacillus flagellatus TaxID=1157490 RepID=A0A074LK59_9BACL|nr:hypothetical protein [Tumebacillus flagellatus]KEO81489.1 hypothetical protein EL26_20670 [Tumebacillus flagellatus]
MTKVVAAFGAHGISKRVMFTEYLMIEVPEILHEWNQRDALLASSGFSLFGVGAQAASEPRKEEFDEAAFEAALFATGGMG